MSTTTAVSGVSSEGKGVEVTEVKKEAVVAVTEIKKEAAAAAVEGEGEEGEHLDAGGNMKLVQEALGHRDPKTTAKHYQRHGHQEQVAEAAEKALRRAKAGREP